ncbi:MAG TPA: hypothetical protein V6C65_00070 [Allocoleopsis sp.]
MFDRAAFSRICIGTIASTFAKHSFEPGILSKQAAVRLIDDAWQHNGWCTDPLSAPTALVERTASHYTSVLMRFSTQLTRFFDQDKVSQSRIQ